MLLDKPYETALAARLEDYFTSSRHWCRQLWRIGSILEIEELIEAWGAHQRGTLSEASVRYLAQSTMRRVKGDLGFGTPRQRGHLIDLLKRKLTPGSHDAAALKLLLARQKQTYLTTWVAALRLEDKPSIEVVSRAIGSHLLDEGFSRWALSGWIGIGIKRNDHVVFDAADLVEEASKMCQRQESAYEIIIPIKATPPLDSWSHPAWMTAPETAEWLSEHFPHEIVRQAGALRLHLTARDLHSAYGLASDEVVKLIARFRVGARKRLEFSDLAYVPGRKVFPYRRRPRRMQAIGLQQTKAIFEPTLPGGMDSVLELLEPLDEGTPSAAIAGSWAALEAMFIGPEDTMERVRAATRMARIVACSYAVSELNALATAYETTHDDRLATDLMAAPRDTADRASLMEAAIKARGMSFVNIRHQATLDRITHLVEDPALVFPRIIGQLEDVFRRLYRQRNMVLHAGELSSIAMRGTLRTTAPLMGAGIDRVVRVTALRRVTPLQLAAQAEVDLQQVTQGDGMLVAELLR